MTIEHIEIKTALQAHEDGTISGIAWPYGTPDRVGDQIERGAFEDLPATLPMLANHDQAQALGVWDQFEETAEGFVVKGRLLIEDVARAREMRALVKSKAVTGLSIGFITKAAEPLRPRGRRITKAELVEVSLVSVPMHRGAKITSAKAAQATTKESEMTEETGAANTAEIEAKMAEISESVATLPKISERLDKLEAKSNRPGGNAGGNGENRAEIEGKALNAFLRSGAGALDTEQKSALNMGTNSAGGYVVAPEYSRQIIEMIAEISPMRSVASVMAIGTTEILVPVMTTPLAGGWVAETGPRPESQPVFDQLKISTWEHAVTVPVSLQLIEDSFVDLQSYLAGQIGMQFGKAEASAFVNGDGDGKPLGFLDDPDEFEQIEVAQGSIEGDAGSNVISALIETFYRLPTSYARNGSWLMNRRTMGSIRRHADNTTKGTLWSDSLADGTPARFLGRPVVEAPDMPDPISTADPAVATYPVAFGDFATGYRIVDRVGVQIMRDDYTGADNGIVKIRARRRVGGRLIMPEAIVLLKATA